MNLRELVSASRDLLAESRTNDQWTEWQLRRALEAANMDFFLRRPDAFPHLLRSTSATTSNGTSDYTLPADAQRLEYAELNGLRCKLIPPEQAWWYQRSAFGASVLAPVVEVIDSSTSTYPSRIQARFYPTPGQSTPSYKLAYWKRPHALFQQVATFEDSENWTGAGVSLETNSTGPCYPAAPANIDQYNQEEIGAKNVLLTAAAGGTLTASYVLPEATDFGADTTDVVEIWLNTNKTNVTDVRLQFHTTAGASYYSVTSAATAFSASGARLRIPKSRFAATGTPAWTSIAEVRVLLTATAAATARFDDWRIYRSPEYQEAFHRVLPYYGAAVAMAGDEGVREAGDAANLMATYNALAERLLGGKAA